MSMSEDAYLEGISQLYSVRVCTVNNFGTCFFDSIFLLLPTVGEAVQSAKALRLSCVLFMRECFDGQHGLAGERIKMEVEHAFVAKIISSASRGGGDVSEVEKGKGVVQQKNSKWSKVTCDV